MSKESIFLGILVLLALIYKFKDLIPKINLSIGGVKKYDIQMFFSAIMWNIFWFGLLYYIIGPEKMKEFWFVLIFMVILSLFQYIWKWDYAWALYLGCFFFLIIYFKGNDIKNSLKNDTTETNNQKTSQIANRQIHYFDQNGEIWINVPYGVNYSFYPKGGCVNIYPPYGESYPDCPGKDQYHPQKIGRFKFTKKDATATGVGVHFY